MGGKRLMLAKGRAAMRWVVYRRDVMDVRGGEERGQKGASGAGIFFMKVRFSPPVPVPVASASAAC